MTRMKRLTWAVTAALVTTAASAGDFGDIKQLTQQAFLRLSKDLASVSVNRSRLFVGFDTQLAFATVSAEAEKSGGATSVSSKIGFRF